MRATIEGDQGRPERMRWQESADGKVWDAPWREQSIVYDEAGNLLAIHSARARDDGRVRVRTLFERPVDLPDDQTLKRRAHEDLVSACHAAVTEALVRPVGARLWHMHGPDGALTTFDGFELCDTLDDLLAEPPEEILRVLELPVIASWSRRTFVNVLEDRLVDCGDNDELDDFVIGVVRDLNERLEREHGADGPVVLRCVGWVDEETARPALTETQRARWRAEGWTSRIAAFPGEGR